MLIGWCVAYLAHTTGDVRLGEALACEHVESKLPPLPGCPTPCVPAYSVCSFTHRACIGACHIYIYILFAFPVGCVDVRALL